MIDIAVRDEIVSRSLSLLSHMFALETLYYVWRWAGDGTRLDELGGGASRLPASLFFSSSGQQDSVRQRGDS